MSDILLEHYETAVHAEATEQRIGAVLGVLAERPGLADQKAWLESARRQIAEARANAGDILTRVLRLPELKPWRGDLGRTLQNAAVDSVDGLLAAITALNARSPLIEAIFRNLKTIAMRRVNREDFEAFYDEIEVRLASSYVARMLGDEAYAPIPPHVEKMRAAFAEWRLIFTAQPLAPDLEESLKNELFTLGEGLEIPMRRAFLLAEAALFDDPILWAESHIFDKPRKRAPKAGKPEQLVLESDK